MTTPELTVVIPAFNAEQTLPRVLQELWKQQSEVPHEVVIVNDGSTDGTQGVAERLGRQYGPGYLRVLAHPHRGAAAARNAGSRVAHTSLLLFLGADIIPGPHLLRSHAAVHRRFPAPDVACLGHVTWEPALPPTPFMVFLEHGGPQNAYDEIAGCEWVPPQRYFYGSNLSLKRSLFERVGWFDEVHFSEYGWEDLELGMRLASGGVRLRYEPAARGFHAHRVDVRMAAARMRRAGAGARTLLGLHPRCGVLDLRRERWARILRTLLFPRPVRAVLTAGAAWSEHRSLIPRLYRRVLSLAFYEGVHGRAALGERAVDNLPQLFQKWEKS